MGREERTIESEKEETVEYTDDAIKCKEKEDTIESINRLVQNVTNFNYKDFEIIGNIGDELKHAKHKIYKKLVYLKPLQIKNMRASKAFLNGHPKNILRKGDRLVIIDFGLAKSYESDSDSLMGGVVAYTDPKFFDDNKVRKNIRPAPIIGTPFDYLDIYIRAWHENPNERPDIEEVCRLLDNVKFERRLDETYIDKKFNQIYINESNGMSAENSNYIENLSDAVEFSDSINDVVLNTFQQYMPKDDTNSIKVAISSVNKLHYDGNYSDVVASSIGSNCFAHYHILCDDIEGLKWHLDNGSDVNKTYGLEKRFQGTLIDFTLKYCHNWDALVLIFGMLKSYGASDRCIYSNMQLLCHNHIIAPKDHSGFKKFIIWLIKNSDESMILEIISLYLENEFDPNNPYDYKRPNLLFLVIKEKYSPDIFEIIFRYNINLTVKNNNGLDALGYASRKKNIEAVKYLINTGKFTEAQCVLKAHEQSGYFSKERKYLGGWLEVKGIR
ncbi:5240_t:CDS:2 [Acaulospora colombiana]|uniref:5240_t:CDS:1 n=1 Tax=Acaulospora colombiana TaxID=27376 RepID=A0ACA9JW49_9GLOM|nr:5240_t:CDS:2 [Acaulospora colombiana]